MVTKLRLRQKNGFLIKERVSNIYIYYTEAYLQSCQTLVFTDYFFIILQY